MTNASNRLEQVLLDLLRAAHLPNWPGGDSQTVTEVLDAYPDAVAAGAVPGWQELLRRYPELCDEIQALRLAKGWLEIHRVMQNHKRFWACNVTIGRRNSPH
jgi:hypothetical protein